MKVFNSHIRGLQSPARYVALTLLIGLFAVDVQRAWSESITFDEAHTFNQYLVRPLRNTFIEFDTNNHVLYTLLARLSITFFGASELAVRLPSLLGALLYFWAVFQLCRRVFGESALFLLTVALLTMNPFLLDFQSLARGYGLALALYLLGFGELFRYLTETPDVRFLYRAGASFGLSIAANLTLAVPVAATGVILAIIVLRDAWAAERRVAVFRRLRVLISYLAIPAFVGAALFLAIPLANASRDSFYVGLNSLDDSWDSLITPALVHVIDPSRNDSAAFELVWRLARNVSVFLGLLAVIWLIIAFRWLKLPSFLMLGPAAQFLLFLLGVMLCSLTLLIGAHYVAGVLYPSGRTGLYWLVFLSLSSAGLVKMALESKKHGRPAAVVLGLLLLLCVARYITQWNTHYYIEWLYDANTRQIMERLRDYQKQHGPASARVGVTWQFEPAVNFYRQIFGLHWMQPVERTNADGNFDFYVLMREDEILVSKRALNVVLRGPLSGAILAVPSAAR